MPPLAAEEGIQKGNFVIYTCFFQAVHSASKMCFFPILDQQTSFEDQKRDFNFATPPPRSPP